MNKRDTIITALTAGTSFNGNAKVWRSVHTLAAFCDCETEEIMDLLAGDLGHLVTCKPSTQGKGILVALKDNLQNAEQPHLPAPPGHNEYLASD